MTLFVSDVMVWDILAELVKLCTYPPPLNPFAVDLSYFDNLPLHERALASAAMVNFLQKVMVSNTKHMPYTTKGKAAYTKNCFSSAMHNFF